MGSIAPGWRAAKQVPFWLAVAVLGLVLLETSSYVACRLLMPYTLFYAPGGAQGYADYLARRDPVLGWPSLAQSEMSEYGHGSDRAAAGRTNEDASACVSAFGDSFTFGAGVAPTESYPSALSRELGCPVNNFGVSGYGTDQALLRFRQLGDDRSRMVVLGHYSEGIVRNVNQLRDLIASGRFGLKPRFVITNGELRLIPLPLMDANEFSRIADEHERLLPFEFFRPGRWGGVVRLRFPYSWRLLSALGQYRVLAALQGVPSYAPFYDPPHPSGALDLTVAILAAFVQEAEARGQVPIVLLIPDIADLKTLRDGNPAPYSLLLEALHTRGIVALDAAVGLNRYLGERSPCTIYTACSRGHLNAEGNATLGKLVADRLRPLRDAMNSREELPEDGRIPTP